MRIKQLLDEDFVNYKIASMFIGTSICDWKCCKERGYDISICQNSSLVNSKIMDVPADVIVHRYFLNPITRAIVIGGLEPMLQFDEVMELVDIIRSKKCSDDIVIYTGYDYKEIEDKIEILKKYDNIVMKFGRFIKDNNKHFDEILGVYLASDNQYGERIS